MCVDPKKFCAGLAGSPLISTVTGSGGAIITCRHSRIRKRRAVVRPEYVVIALTRAVCPMK